MTTLPELAPVPVSSLGPQPNEQGFHVGRVERNLFWVTDGTYQSAFLATEQGVVLFDAPPSIGGNLRRAVDEVTAAEGLTNHITHLVYSHHHADHAGAAGLFGPDVLKVGHVETARLLRRASDPKRPPPTVVFEDTYTLLVGGERIELTWHGPNHSPDNIFIRCPDHDALMVIDIVNAGWIPVYQLNLSEDVPGYFDAVARVGDLPWTHLIGGHLGRLATRDDIALHRRYLADVETACREALASVNPLPHFAHHGPNAWAAVRDWMDELVARVTAPIVAKYTGALAAADVEEMTASTAFTIIQSLRLDEGVGSRIRS